MQQKGTETEFWLHAFLANALSAMTNKCDNFLPYLKKSSLIVYVKHLKLLVPERIYNPITAMLTFQLDNTKSIVLV